jgi:hypothetical protein
MRKAKHCNCGGMMHGAFGFGALEHWDRGFESRSVLDVYPVFYISVEVLTIRSLPKEAYQMSKK